MTYTVEKFTARVRVYVYVARLFSVWLYIIATCLLSLFVLVDIPDKELEERSNRPIVAITIWLSMLTPVVLLFFFGSYCIYYWMRVAGEVPRLTLGEKILLPLSLDLIVNPLWTNWLINLLDLDQPIRVPFLVFWSIHTMTTLVSIVVIGKYAYIHCVRWIKRFPHHADAEQISLLTFPKDKIETMI
jgi:hypothetical protein